MPQPEALERSHSLQCFQVENSDALVGGGEYAKPPVAVERSADSFPAGANEMRQLVLTHGHLYWFVLGFFCGPFGGPF